MTYKDKCLTAQYIEFAQPIRFVKKYKNKQIIQVGESLYTIIDNLKSLNDSFMFSSVRKVINFIDNERIRNYETIF